MFILMYLLNLDLNVCRVLLVLISKQSIVVICLKLFLVRSLLHLKFCSSMINQVMCCCLVVYVLSEQNSGLLDIRVLCTNSVV